MCPDEERESHIEGDAGPQASGALVLMIPGWASRQSRGSPRCRCMRQGGAHEKEENKKGPGPPSPHHVRWQRIGSHGENKTTRDDYSYCWRR